MKTRSGAAAGPATLATPARSRVAVDARMMRSSGIGRYIRELVPLLRRGGGLRLALIGDLANVRALATGNEPVSGRPNDDRVSAEVTFHHCAAPIYSVREQLELPRAIPCDADTIWVPHYNFPLRARGRLVVTVHDVLHLAHPAYVRGAHRRGYARMMFSRLRGRADAIIVDSRFTADELVRHARIDPRRIQVVHLGVGMEWFAARVDTGTQSGRPYFLYVGNVKPHKNLGILLEAFRVAGNVLAHDLVIAGRREGLLGGDHAVVVAAARFGGRVRFTGEVSDAELRALVAGAEALVLPSRYEGFGLPALEAMAAGCPAIVSNAGSLPEVCGDAALYFHPADAHGLADHLVRVAEDRHLRDDLVAAGRAHAGRFTWERCAALTREVLVGQ